jgi:predicted glutamine amidotransferase
MARLIGYIANRADRLRDALHQERHAITGLPADRRGAWGLGFYQGGEVLHKKQPSPDGAPIDWGVIAANVRTDCAIAHVRQPTVGGFSVDNTHPFRLRQWLFAHVGTVACFDELRDDLAAQLPDFLRRNIRGNSDSELFFHLVLAGLHTRNQLEAPDPAEAVVQGAVADAVRAIDKRVPAGNAPSVLNALLSNGRAMYALRRGAPFGHVERAGVSEPLEPFDERPRPGSPLLRYVMLVSGGADVPQGYSPLGEGHLMVVNHALDVRTAAL